MANKKSQNLFGKDLRYLPHLSDQKHSFLSASVFWFGIFIAISILIVWFGRALDAAVEAPTNSFEERIYEIKKEPGTIIDVSTGIDLLPTIDGIRGVEYINFISTNKNSEKDLSLIERSNIAQKLKEYPEASSEVNPSDIDNLEDQEKIIGEHTQQKWHQFKVQKGDSLVTIFKNAGLKEAEAIKLSKIPGAEALSNLKEGSNIEILIKNSSLKEVNYKKEPYEFLNIQADNRIFKVENRRHQTQSRQKEISIEITDSIYQSALRAGLDKSIISRLIDIFQWELNFKADIRRGDRLTVILEEEFFENHTIGKSLIVAASLESKHGTHMAIKHKLTNGSINYFAPSGENLQRTFLPTPVPGAYITSPFSFKRLHPILKVKRPHLGIDYGAPTGTPVLATADGKIILASRKGGYGKTIIVEHNQKYKTLYAHLSKFATGARTGKRVKKGQVIGYVGSTGLSTGPHLHYEFLVNGKQKDPSRVDYPRAQPVTQNDRPHFIKQSQVLVERLIKVNKT